MRVSPNVHTIRLSKDEITTIFSLLGQTRGVNGIDVDVIHAVSGVGLRRLDQWSLKEIPEWDKPENFGVFAFDGDEDTFRRDLVLIKVMTR